MSVIINGDTGITTPAETVQGALTTTGNTILGDASTDTLNVGNGGLVKDASGNVGIGTASPATKLNLGGSSDQTFQVNGSGTAAFLGTSTSVAQISSNRNPTTGAIYDSGRAASYINLEAASGNSNIQFNTSSTNNVNPTERMRIDSSGNVGIGVTTPTRKLDIMATVVGNSDVIAIGNNEYSSSTYPNTNSASLIFNRGSSFPQGGITASNETSGSLATGYLAFKTATGGNLVERMRIDSSGNLLVGQTAQSLSGKFCITFPSDTFAGVASTTSATTSQTHTRFANGNGVVGAISTSGSATTYATSSDYRLKNTIAPMMGALAKVALLKPVTYKWKVDGSDGQGFIAHELDAVVPGCVTGEKDAVDAEGKPQYQGIDTSFLVATLTAAIQEQQALITQLQADVATLKALSA